jgi:hypothetical protein
MPAMREAKGGKAFQTRVRIENEVAKLETSIETAFGDN